MYGKIIRRNIVIGFFFFQAEDGIRDLVRSRGLGDVYKRQIKLNLSHINFQNVKIGKKWTIANEQYTILDKDRSPLPGAGDIE